MDKCVDMFKILMFFFNFIFFLVVGEFKDVFCCNVVIVFGLYLFCFIDLICFLYERF